MAKQVRITYARRAPFVAVELPVSPSRRLSRGESAVVSEEDARALRRALGTPALPGLSDKYFTFDPVDEPVDEPTSGPGGRAPAGELPEDFPGRDDLAAAGFTSREAVESASDDELRAVRGIGGSTLQKVRSYAWPK